MIHEIDCEFEPDNASPGKIIRGDGDLIVHSSQIGIDSRIPHNRCILPNTIDITFNTGETNTFSFVGPSYSVIDVTSDEVAFNYWVYVPDGTRNINLHVLHG